MILIQKPFVREARVIEKYMEHREEYVRRLSQNGLTA